MGVERKKFLVEKEVNLTAGYLKRPEKKQLARDHRKRHDRKNNDWSFNREAWHGDRDKGNYTEDFKGYE